MDSSTIIPLFTCSSDTAEEQLTQLQRILPAASSLASETTMTTTTTPDWQARALAAARRLTAAAPEARTIMAIVLDLYRERDTQSGLSAAVKRCRGAKAWTPALAEAVDLVARELGIEVNPDEAAGLAFLGDRPRGLAERLLIAWGYPLIGFVAAPSPSLDDQIERMEGRAARGVTRGIPSLPRRRLE